MAEIGNELSEDSPLPDGGAPGAERRTLGIRGSPFCGYHQDTREPLEVRVAGHEVTARLACGRKDESVHSVEPVLALQVGRVLRDGAIDRRNRRPKLDELESLGRVSALGYVFRLQLG